MDSLGSAQGSDHQAPLGVADATDHALDEGETRRSFAARLKQLLHGEISQLHPRAQLALSLAARLPQFAFPQLRTAILRAGNLQIGKGSLVMGEIHLSGAGDWRSLFSIGNNSFVTGPLRINLGAEIRIGDDVNIGHDVMLLTVNHKIGNNWRRAGFSTFGPIVIGDGVWIASRAIVLPGVTIGRGAVVAAGAVVVRDVQPHTLVGGAPARVLRPLDPLAFRP